MFLDMVDRAPALIICARIMRYTSKYICLQYPQYTRLFTPYDLMFLLNPPIYPPHPILKCDSLTYPKIYMTEELCGGVRTQYESYIIHHIPSNIPFTLHQFLVKLDKINLQIRCFPHVCFAQQKNPTNFSPAKLRPVQMRSKILSIENTPSRKSWTRCRGHLKS